MRSRHVPSPPRRLRRPRANSRKQTPPAPQPPRPPPTRHPAPAHAPRCRHSSRHRFLGECGVGSLGPLRSRGPRRPPPHKRTVAAADEDPWLLSLIGPRGWIARCGVVATVARQGGHCERCSRRRRRRRLGAVWSPCVSRCPAPSPLPHFGRRSKPPLSWPALGTLRETRRKETRRRRRRPKGFG